MPRHEGIRQHKSGLWELRIRLNGKRHSFYTATCEEAVDLKAEKLNDKRMGLPLSAKGTVADFLTRWLEGVRHSIDPATYDQYAAHLRLYLAPRDPSGRYLPLPHLGAIKLGVLGPDQVRAWMASLLKRLSPRTTQLALTVFRHALDSAVADGILARNVAKLVKRPKADKPKIRVFEPDEAIRFLAAVRGRRLEALYVTTLRLGLRESEVLGLRWSDVNFEAGSVTITQTVKRIGRGTGASKLVFGGTKTDSSRATLALSAPLIAALKAHRPRQAEERLAAGRDWHNHDLVFATHIGTPIEASNLRREFYKILASAELPRIKFHELRHSAASLLINEGVPLKTIQELLRHSSIQITADTYSHLSRRTMQEAGATMDRILAQ